jgi:hypothetical protein
MDDFEYEQEFGGTLPELSLAAYIRELGLTGVAPEVTQDHKDFWQAEHDAAQSHLFENNADLIFEEILDGYRGEPDAE